MNGISPMSSVDQGGHDLDDSNPVGPPMIDDLIQRAKTLLSELELLYERLRTLRRESHVELAHFRSTIQSELSMLQRLSDKPDDDATKHVARSSNLPFLETIWSTAKASKDVVSLQKRIYTAPGVKSASQGMRYVDTKGEIVEQRGTKRGAVAIDAITDLGTTWSKVSHVTNQRLLFDLAKQGWNSGGSDYDDDEETNAQQTDDDDFDVPLLKTAKTLTSAARCFRVRTKTPTVHLILPRIQYGELAEVDNILDACRATGAVLFLSDQQKASPPIATALHNMAPDPLYSFSDTLNIDCTVLLALVSEFSHAKVHKQPWFHTALQRQVEIEDNENLLPSLLYPAMSSRKLICTHEAAKRMREIVSSIGTQSEKARTAIMMGDDASKSRSDLLDEMQEWSAYQVPRDWQLPILSVDQNEGDCQRHLPPQAKGISEALTPINASVFLYGWATGRTTVTSNRTIVHQINNALEAFDDLDDEAVWPKIWLCPTARSLVGKEKRGPKRAAAPVVAVAAADGGDGEKGVTTRKGWPLPDPLRREQHRRNGLDVLARRKGLSEVEDRKPNGDRHDDVLVVVDTSLQ
ncbi:hypothetical protein LTR48_001067 [Friedmanniomyces endolithicus]|uniref:DUF1308 domain-containing protein n=2 Tax=Dothideomycetidae TaxID=451867 RepID=A0A4U0UP09_9PEZI|nr:hypothetical protein LTS09_013034 [Friedmanniomyces endolithicus]KAK1094061.1 hypothetical protein LTR48_001067 [Friedmanniomyces endolithicus]KAK1812528.1 hypothetical protein LTR12_013114 [Friedmanniomyces endolithicus]KAK5145096.1 hypothetical protein LTR32_003093 [Rachicladosporium monterosium]TKA37510.1 hypothetical protein B0A54_11468 [Friedmanniomyces endolithicus]